MPSDLTLGAEYNYDGLEDEVIGYERYMKQKVRIAGTYLQTNGRTNGGASSLEGAWTSITW